MIDFLENIGDYFSQHFFGEDFPKKVFDKSGYTAEHIKEFTGKIAPISEKYYKFKNDFLNLRRKKDKILRAHQFHTELLESLGYINGVRAYDEPVVMDDNKIIPVWYRFNKNDRPYLYIMEMQPMIQEGEADADGLYEQSYVKDDWEKVLPDSWDDFDIRPEVIKEALSELFLLPEEDRPVYLIMLAGPKIFLIQYEKWKFDSYLLFDLEELFTVTKTASNRNLLALFYALLAKKQFISETESILSGLEEDAHKASYGVTVTLKSAVIYAVEALANEAIEFRLKNASTQDDKRKIVELRNSDNFARELKDECLNFVYRLLFLFYAESREDLEILPVKDSTYQKGYSLEMLRDLEMVALTTESSRNGYFFSESLWKLFGFLHNGSELKDGFQMRPLDSPLFDNDALKHLKGIQFTNKVLQEIVVRLSLSERTKRNARGRISYSNLGINQLGSVYESLLSYSGFFASEELIEVKNAKDKNGSDGTFLVPKSRRDDFKEAEILKELEHPEQDVVIPKGHFVYRLNGRDRKNSASYYTPEVLTQCTVKYTLKGIIERLKKQQAIVDGQFTGTNCADEILQLKILEPAMGAAAFHNEVINQLSVAYLELKENEEQAAGRKRITPGVYKDEVQKVKAFIAANNVYGVDLNPTAVELGKLSLWLNCMHKNMETPFFAHRLGAGNAVVGAWLKVYSEKDCSLEYPTDGTAVARRKPIPKPWWDKVPKRVTWNKNGSLSRKPNQIYHFLLPDDNMVPSYGIRLLKDELSETELQGFKDWRSEFKQPLTSIETNRLKKISGVIDYLLEEHYKQQKGVIADTSSVYQVYGQPNPQITTKGYDEKERLTESRMDRSAPYYKLKLVLDYWCSLWFWDVRDVRLLPSRTEWYNEVESILQIDSNELSVEGTDRDIKEQIRNKARAGTLFDSYDRIEKVAQLAEQHRFFHNEIEFIEVFKERGGFDVIVGNPPWDQIEFDEVGIAAEQNPIYAIRNSDNICPIYNEDFLFEFIKAESSKAFSRSKSLYPLNTSSKSNLCKLFVENNLQIGKNIGLVHDRGIYSDTKGYSLRKICYSRLEYLFRFNNELKLFFDVGNAKKYEVSVFREKDNSEINFFAISNLYNPSTIPQIFSNRNDTIYKQRDDNGNWEINGNFDRAISIDVKELKFIGDNFDKNKSQTAPILPYIHSDKMFNILKKLLSYEPKLNDVIESLRASQMLNEKNAVQENILERNPGAYGIDEMIWNGANIYPGNPYYQTPNLTALNHRDYSRIQLNLENEKFLPFSVYRLLDLKATKYGKNYVHSHRRRAINTNERTYISAILPPQSIHVRSLYSIEFEDFDTMLIFSSSSISIVMDFIIRSTGKEDIVLDLVKQLPLLRDKIADIIIRGCILNSVSEAYESLWNYCFENFGEFVNGSNNNIINLNKLPKNFELNQEIRSPYFRRQLEIEIDVLVSMALKLTLDDLINIYLTDFSVLYVNENDTWYDVKGSIVFTCSKGLVGVGLDRGDWNGIKEMKEGETHEHTIIKSELYKGKKVTYYAPFTKCDRVEDYKTVWTHFEQVFKTENN